MNSSRKGREGRKERDEFYAKAARGIVVQSVGDSLDSVLKTDFAKVDQETQAPVTQPQLREDFATFASFA